MSDLTVNRFRAARGRKLGRQIADLATHFGRPVEILDVGGRADYWDNVGYDNIRGIRLLNIEEVELRRKATHDIFTWEIGDARDLSKLGDKSIDLIHSNSVIEHVGAWPDICAMADELLRVGHSGWVQTPAWEFPIEPHFKLPFLHWFGQPFRRALLRVSPDYGSLGVRERRLHIDRINLLSYAEFRSLFPQAEIMVERLVVAKSYVARWGPFRRA